MALMLRNGRASIQRILPLVSQMNYSSGEWGSGAGKGGGSGGSIRDSGGAFGKQEAAREEEYFRKLQKLQIDNLKKDIDQEIKHHEAEIERHKNAIKRHKQRQKELQGEGGD